MNRKLSQFLISSTFAVSLALAQSSSTAPNSARFVQRKVNMLTTLLSLSTAQQQQATTLFTTSASADSTARASLRAAHTTLNTAVKNNDANGIQQAAASIGSLTAQMAASDASAQAAFYQILTPDQQAKYTQFESSGHGGMIGSGFHGRGGRPAPPAPNN
jgi:Spy/CpxP family protein refolding chaperone